MKLKYVTLTGADETVKPEELIELALKYAYVEWAILFSKSRSGTCSRYPDTEWVDSLIDLSSNYPHMNFSAHLCGKLVEEALAGEITVLRDEYFKLRFQRIQLNMGGGRLRASFKNKALQAAILKSDKQVILGGNYDGITGSGVFADPICAYPLFDASGGRGIESKVWPKPFTITNYDAMDESKDKLETVFCGYAGGLGPDNVVSELSRIQDVAGDATIWIDMESKLRSEKDGKDIFDLEKCEEVLKAVKPFVRQ